ncbi:MAG: hypothetical protein HPY74_17200 [Firmicutes bacterium]|nr:hypothetical protein [Bacillota bacterium]
MNIGKCLWEQLGIHISGGLSRIEEGIFALPAMYSQARTACQYRFISGKRKLITYDEIPVIYVNNNLKKAERVEYLRQVLQTMDKEKIIMSLSFLKIEENEVCNTDIESVREIFEKYTWVLIEFMQKQGIIDNFEPLIRHFYSYLLKQGSLKELNEAYKNGDTIVNNIIKAINN